MEAKVSSTIRAPRAAVWEALTDPALIKQYMFGTDVLTDWRPGSRIEWTGAWEGKRYADKGEVVHVVPQERLVYTHFSPLSGLPDAPEHYRTVDVRLQDEDGATRVVLTQDNNADQAAKEHSEKNWTMVLDGLKRTVEG